jgi:hypothetical protein
MDKTNLYYQLEKKFWLIISFYALFKEKPGI